MNRRRVSFIYRWMFNRKSLTCLGLGLYGSLLRRRSLMGESSQVVRRRVLKVDRR
jgi:hypothetical protein